MMSEGKPDRYVETAISTAGLILYLEYIYILSYGNITMIRTVFSGHTSLFDLLAFVGIPDGVTTTAGDSGQREELYNDGVGSLLKL